MLGNNKGFTIVEIVVTVVVVSILVSIAVFGYNQVQKDARNSERDSKIKLLVEALEKYYSKKGEYPSCTALTQSASQVVTNVLPGLDPNVLIAPNSPAGTTNSITCTALTPGGTDAFAYIGDGSASCSSGNACLQYTLQYQNENTGAIVALDGRHKTQVAATTGSTISATVISDTQINLSWTAVGNATSYQLQRATDTNFTTNVVSSSPSVTTASASGLASGTTYYFRVAPIGSTGQGTWSNTTSATTTIASPAAPTIAAALNGTNTQGTLTAVTCGSGTPEYQLQSRSSNTTSYGSWPGWGGWSATTPAALTLSVAASQGYQYEFRGQARCTGPNASSSPTLSSNTAFIIRPIDTPPAPTYLSPSFFDSPNHAIVNFASNCPSGTTAISKTFRSRAWSGTNWGPNPWNFDDWWVNNTGSNKNVEYWGKNQCQTSHSTSAMSPESYNVIVVTP